VREARTRAYRFAISYKRRLVTPGDGLIPRGRMKDEQEVELGTRGRGRGRER